ncbi:AMP-binding protein [Robbsia sp. Bb-Pol-6]|uniref:AMP-binding protein n=1 Tax=Robbsia betulipollinis TaxID=2981849 RepID=A0ABT3ZKF7_9BURK|nr:AMP-binding protein [Robbsia betulipollinis]MCY0387014.1 AMP-binding protein [Robbsia betulipollinis]
MTLPPHGLSLPAPHPTGPTAASTSTSTPSGLPAAAGVSGIAADFGTLDAPLAHWAACRPAAIALDDGDSRMSFAALAQAVAQGAAELDAARAPASVWLDAVAAWRGAAHGAPAPAASRDPQADVGLVGRLRDFLAIVASGRAAAVGDADWPPGVRERLVDVLDPARVTMPPPGPGSPFYIGFTSGSTGVPKGFRRDHRSWAESFRVALDEFGAGARARVFCPGRLSHSLFLFGALLGVWTGAGVRLQARFSAGRALALLRDGEHCMVAVPSQLLLMLELAARRAVAPLPGVRLIMISGARWMRERTPALRALFPNARLVEFYGASETSFVAWTDADPALPGAVVGRPFANVEIAIRDARGADVPPGAPGLIHVRSPMLFRDYVGAGADDTAALRDGPWLSVRDVGRIDAQGRLCLIGREKRMIVTQGRNLFPEEVEQVLLTHPALVDASVQPQHDPLRGTRVVAVVRFAPGAHATRRALAAWCGARLETYKVPRRLWRCDAWPLTASGKTDHPALARALAGAHASDANDANDARWLIPI